MPTSRAQIPRLIAVARSARPGCRGFEEKIEGREPRYHGRAVTKRLCDRYPVAADVEDGIDEGRAADAFVAEEDVKAEAREGVVNGDGDEGQNQGPKLRQIFRKRAE